MLTKAQSAMDRRSRARRAVAVRCPVTYLEDDQLELGDVVRVNPVLGRLADEALLAPTGGTVAPNGVSSTSDEVVQLRQLDHKGIVVLLEEGLRVQPGREDGLQMPRRLFLDATRAAEPTKTTKPQENTTTYIVLLDDLQEAGIVERRESGKVVHVGYDVAEIGLEEVKVFVDRLGLIRAQARGPAAVEVAHDVLDGLIGRLDPSDNLFALLALEGEDLIQLGLEPGHEAALVVGGPSSPSRLSALALGRRGRHGLVRGLEAPLQAVVVDVELVVILDERRPQLPPEPMQQRKQTLSATGSLGERCWQPNWPIMRRWCHTTAEDVKCGERLTSSQVHYEKGARQDVGRARGRSSQGQRCRTSRIRRWRGKAANDNDDDGDDDDDETTRLRDEWQTIDRQQEGRERDRGEMEASGYWIRRGARKVARASARAAPGNPKHLKLGLDFPSSMATWDLRLAIAGSSTRRRGWTNRHVKVCSTTFDTFSSTQSGRRFNWMLSLARCDY